MIIAPHLSDGVGKGSCKDEAETGAGVRERACGGGRGDGSR